MIKALLRSNCSKTVRCAGFFWLKPPAMAWLKSCRAVTVECSALKPCCISGTFRCSVRVGRMRPWSIFMVRLRRDTGW